LKRISSCMKAMPSGTMAREIKPGPRNFFHSSAHKSFLRDFFAFCEEVSEKLPKAGRCKLKAESARQPNPSSWLRLQPR
jgi:hypothetical protein